MPDGTIAPVTELEISFVSEEASYRNVLGWYNKRTGEAGFLFADANDDGTSPGAAPGDTARVSALQSDIDSGDFGFFLIPDGAAKIARLGGADGPIRFELDRAGRGEIFYDTARGEHELWGAGGQVLFSDRTLNVRGADYMSGQVGTDGQSKAQKFGTQSDGSDGIFGLMAWDDQVPHAGNRGSDRDFNDAVFNVTVVPPTNAAPTDIALSNATVPENAPGATIGILSVTDPDGGDTHTYTVSDPRFEVVGNDLVLKQSEALDYEAEPQVVVTVATTDQAGNSYSEDFTIAVRDVDEGNSGDLTGTVIEDAGITATGQIVLPDPDGDGNTAVAAGGATTYGFFSINSSGAWVYDIDATNALVQALNDGEVLKDLFTIKGADPVSELTVEIVINGTNDAPVAHAASFSTPEETVLTGALTATDVDRKTLTYALEGPAPDGLVVKSDGTFTYMPPAGTSGPVTFSYVARDAAMSSLPATATIHVTGGNTAPDVSGDLSGKVREDAMLTATGAVVFLDPDAGESGAKAGSGSAAYGTWSVDETGAWSYQVNNAAPGVQALGDGVRLKDYFSVTSLDGSVTKTVTVMIVGSNDIPTVSGDFSGGVGAGVPSASGRLNFVDVDYGESAPDWFTPLYTEYGSWYIGSDGGWRYDLNPGAAYAIGEGNVVVESFPVESLDRSIYFLVDIYISGADRPDGEGQMLTSGISVDPAVQQAQPEVVPAAQSVRAGSIPALPPDDAAIRYISHRDDDGLDGAALQASVAPGDIVVVTNRSTPIEGKVSAPGINAPGGNYALLDAPDHGMLALGAGGTFVYTPTAGYAGADRAIVRVTDAQGGTRDIDVGIRVDTPKLATRDDLPAKDFAYFGPGLQSNADSVTPTAALADGGHLVTWVHQTPDSADVSIHAQRFNAAGEAMGDAFRVNSTVGTFITAPSAAALPDGGFVVTWQDVQLDGTGYGIFARRFATDGTPLGGELPVNSTMDSSQTQPAVAALPDGFVVTWLSAFQDGNYNRIYGQRFDSSGSAVGGEFLVGSTALGNQANPATATLADGGFVVTWWSWDSTTADSIGIYARRFNADGTPAAEDFRVGGAVTDEERYPSIAALPDGGFVIAWTVQLPTTIPGETPGFTFSDVHAQRFDADGGPVGDEFRVNTTRLYWQYDPAVTALSNGGFFVVWVDSPSFGGIVGQRYNAAGQAVGGEVRISSEYGFSQVAPSVVERVDGSLVITWNDGQGDIAQKVLPPNDVPAPPVLATPAVDSDELVAGGPAADFVGGERFSAALADGGHVVIWNRSGEGVFARLYDSSGAPEGEEFSLTALVGGLRTAPTVAALPDGGFVVSWLQSDGNNPVQYHTLVQRFEADGSAIGPEMQADSGARPYVSYPMVTALESGGFVVTWVGQDNYRSNTYGQSFDSDGQPVGSEFRINSDAGNGGVPLTASLPDGGFVVIWHSGNSILGYSQINGQRYSAAGEEVGEAFLVNGSFPAESYLPSVDALADGGFVVSWVAGGKDTDIYAQRYDASAAAVGQIFTVNSNQVQNQYSPAVTGLSDGGFVVCWQSRVPENGEYRVYARHFGADGDPVGEDVRISNMATGTQSSPSVIEREDGSLIFTWNTLENDLSADVAQKIVSRDAFVGKTLTGGDGSDSLTGSVNDDGIAGFGGDDLILGLGARDRLWGGDGDDIIRASDLRFLVIDGGAGNDVLEVASAGHAVDLSELRDKITNIEEIDFGGTGQNSIGIELADVLEITDADRTLIVSGGTDDLVSFAAADWTLTGTQAIGGQTYGVYEGGGATLLVDQELQQVAA